MRRRLAAIAACGLVALAACGDDGPSAEEQFCSAGEALQADVSGLADFDVVASGTDALTTRFESIKTNLTTMRESGSELASEEIDTFEDSIGEVESALAALGADLSIDNAGDVINSVTGAASAGAAVITVYTDSCS